ncbi:hypothetical protein K470DRAFT_176209 [Piedraia hortae CBS 480.64]|uniref:Uncharacterized protein n=1 Tax=Piedraia hortae CBS 480.64 TaxID=1314780 RepID=A0A6A7C5G8_9PEZI|nr:hypothetical protein K470DRAFT_176209 [Piedraia hortae CBS 480.64]
MAVDPPQNLFSPFEFKADFLLDVLFYSGKQLLSEQFTETWRQVSVAFAICRILKPRWKPTLRIPTSREQLEIADLPFFEKTMATIAPALAITRATTTGTPRLHPIRSRSDGAAHSGRHLVRLAGPSTYPYGERDLAEYIAELVQYATRSGSKDVAKKSLIFDNVFSEMNL